jgi:hypothetical protein
MVSMLATRVVDHDFEPWSGQSKDYKLVFAASPSMQHQRMRAMTGLLINL